ASRPAWLRCDSSLVPRPDWFLPSAEGLLRPDVEAAAASPPGGTADRSWPAPAKASEPALVAGRPWRWPDGPAAKGSSPAGGRPGRSTWVRLNGSSKRGGASGAGVGTGGRGAGTRAGAGRSTPTTFRGAAPRLPSSDTSAPRFTWEKMRGGVIGAL